MLHLVQVLLSGRYRFQFCRTRLPTALDRANTTGCRLVSRPVEFAYYDVVLQHSLVLLGMAKPEIEKRKRKWKKMQEKKGKDGLFRIVIILVRTDLREVLGKLELCYSFEAVINLLIL